MAGNDEAGKVRFQTGKWRHHVLWPGECVSPLQFPVKDRICCPVVVGILHTIRSCGSWGGDRENVQDLGMRHLDGNRFYGYHKFVVEALLKSLSYDHDDPDGANLVGYGADNNRLCLLYNVPRYVIEAIDRNSNPF